MGVAGGVNVYRFNNGNPVSFGDPFGLCPNCRNELSSRTPEEEARFQENLTPRDRLALGGMAIGAAVGGLGVMALSSSSVAAAAATSPLLPSVPTATAKLEMLAEKFGMSPTSIVNQALTQGQRMIDAGNSGNVNAIIARPDGAAGFVRVTMDPTQSRVISAGMQSVGMVKNGIAKGRFILFGQ